MTDREMSCAPLPRCPVMSAFNRHLNRHLLSKPRSPLTIYDILPYFIGKLNVDAGFPVTRDVLGGENSLRAIAAILGFFHVSPQYIQLGK